jgi:hypothetical protein
MKKELIDPKQAQLTSWEYLKFLSLQRHVFPAVNEEHQVLVGSIASRAKKITDIPLTEILERTDKFVQGYMLGVARLRCLNPTLPHFPEIHDDNHHNVHGLAHASLVCMEARKFWGRGFCLKSTTLESFFSQARNIPPDITLGSYKKFLAHDIKVEKKNLLQTVLN